MPDISVIILTYNSQNYIEKLIKSFLAKYESEIDAGRLEIIVADNNSSDNTLKIARQTKKAIILENGDNFGFAKGINLASKNAKGKFLLFVNPDGVFVNGDIFSLKDKFEDNIAVVGGEILHTHGTQELSCGKFYNFFNTLLLCLGLEENLGVRFSSNKEKFVDFVSGGFMMVKKDLFLKFGGFDENLFMYVEDMEFCFRLKKKNYKILFSNLATLKHVGQASSDKTFAIVNIYKGILYFHKKHMGIFSFYLVKFMLFSKALLLVMIGKMSNNQYLDRTYKQALKASI